MHTDTDTVDIDDIDAALDASADDKEQDAAPTFAELGVPKPLVHVLAMDGKVTAFPIQADTLADSLICSVAGRPAPARRSHSPFRWSPA